MTTLAQLKQSYVDGTINPMKLGHAVKGVADELAVLIPDQIEDRAKLYLYIHDLPIDSAVCPTSGQNKRFASFSKGFQQYCGNQSACICNKEGSQRKLNATDKDEWKKRSDKRKATNNEKYGVDFASQLPETKIKAELTCMQRYGTASPTQNAVVLAKSSTTCLINNGVSWPQQNELIYKKTTDTFVSRYGVARPAQNAAVHHRMQETMLSRHGVVNPMHIQSIVDSVVTNNKLTGFDKMLSFRGKLEPQFTKEAYATATADTLFLWKCSYCETAFYETISSTLKSKCPTCNPSTMTWGEQLIANWLTTAGLVYEVNNTKMITPLHLDFYIPSLNLAIEFNGTYWHSEKANRGRTYHFNKYKKCEELGIKLIQVFEHELINSEALIKNRIMHAISKTPNKTAARKLKVTEITSVQARVFFNENHLQSGMISKVNYGLVDSTGQLYSVMSFTKSRFSKNLAEWELTRFASLAGWSVVGAAQKLFKHFVKIHAPGAIVSYANLQWGKGGVYDQMGFAFAHYSQPNYWYFKNINDIKSRVKFQKHKLPQELHHLGSEWVIMQHLGWNRFWDCGNAVWVWHNPA